MNYLVFCLAALLSSLTVLGLLPPIDPPPLPVRNVSTVVVAS